MNNPPKSSSRLMSLTSLSLVPFLLAGSLLAVGPTAVAPYHVSVFAKSVTGKYTKPDDIEIVGNRIFVVFGNGVAKDGSDNGSSTLVEFRPDGSVARTFSIKGHSDGLKVDPSTGLLWVLQNEDGNPNLVILNPNTGDKSVYAFETPEHGGGYDDLAFANGKVFMTASNPSANPNTAPAVVAVHLSGGIVHTESILKGNAIVLDLTTNQPVTLNLQDPDSMRVAPNGDLVVTSQDDAELILIQHPGEDMQHAYRLPFSSGGMPAKVDDTVFATASDGFLLVSDLDADTIYRIDKLYWANGSTYSATVGLLGQLDFETGILKPIVTGLTNPRGTSFFINVPHHQSEDDGADR